MKTKLKYICLSAAAGLTLSLSSCSDFMDLTPEDQYDEATVWSDADLAKTVVNDVYSYVCDIAQEVNPDAWTDDAFFTHVYGCRDINEATVSPSNLGAYDRDDCPFKWSKQYKGIYRANLVLANIDNVPEKTGVDLNILKGETYFLRAYIYTELLRGFGGVPIVDKVYSIEEASALNLPRANVADVMDFILKDIEQATNLLPEQQIGVNLGRATKGAAKALKARLLLHVASPLFADRTVNKLECNQYTGDRQALYQQALDAAKDVINDSNYSLIDCNAGTIKEIAEKFHNIIITNNEETIWSKQYVNKDLNADNWVRNRVALLHGPNGYHNWAGTAPTHDLVMAFETEEGKIPNTLLKPGESTTENPYMNREPRFYVNIGYSHAWWPMGSTTESAKKNVNIDYWNGANSGKNHSNNNVYNITGYTSRKYINPQDAMSGSGARQKDKPFPIIRYAEILLAYAEALNNLTQAHEIDGQTYIRDTEAIKYYFNQIRYRAGIPGLTTDDLATADAFNKVIQRERLIELFWEGQRYYDIRRWGIVEDLEREPLMGLNVEQAEWEGFYQPTVIQYKSITERDFKPKMVWLPLHLDEIRKVSVLDQNPGWDK